MHASKMNCHCQKGKAQWPDGHASLAEIPYMELTGASLPSLNCKLLNQEQHNWKLPACSVGAPACNGCRLW